MSTRVERFQVNRASRNDAAWLRKVLNREGARFGTQARMKEEDTLTLEWT
ncbi:MAG: hypothetical protein ACOC6H_00515 [Thermoproteota archaeon]